MKRSAIVCLLAALMLAAVSSDALANRMYVGETASGRMAGPGSVHAFTLDMVAGQVARLSIKAKSSGDQAPSVTVLDPRGALIGDAAGKRSMTVTMSAAITGTYRIRLTAVDGSSARFAMSLSGRRSRKMKGDAGKAVFDAVEGSTLEIQVRSPRGTRPDVDAFDARGRPIALQMKGKGRKLTAKSDPLAGTGAVRVAYAPADSAAMVRIRNPKPRGRINVGMAPAPAAPAPSAPVPADPGGGTTAPPPPAPNPPLPPNPPAPPASPAPPQDDEAPEEDGADQGYLAAVLFEGPADEQLAQALAVVAGEGLMAIDEMVDRLRESFPDAVLDRLREALDEYGLAGRSARDVTLERMGALVDAHRRLERADARMQALSLAVDQSAMAANPEYEREAIDAAEEVDARRAAFEQAMSEGLRSYLLIRDSSLADALKAPVAADDAAALAGIEALEREVFETGLLDKAFAGDPEALDLSIAVYRTNLAMCQGSEEGEARRLEISDILRDLEFAAAEEHRADDADRLVFRAHGAVDPAAVVYRVEHQAGDVVDLGAEGIEMGARPGQELVIAWEAGESRGTVPICTRRAPNSGATCGTGR